MSKENNSASQPSRNSFKGLQLQIEDFREKRDELNQKTKEFITELQEIDTEIDNLLRVSKENYKKKRDYWNSKVKILKEKKNEYKTILDSCMEERKALQKEFRKDKNPKNNFSSIKQIERKIENLERVIETEKLDIAEENSIIDKIGELAEVKQDFMSEQKNSEVFKIDRKIQIVKINLNKIYEQLTKWSNKSQNYHSKLQEVYDRVNELKEKKKKTEEELIDNKKAADAYHEQFLKVMNQRKTSPKKKGPYNRNKKPERSQRPYGYNKEKNDELQKLKETKLATALEKQKAGKRLNLYEARLILESRN
ncbi:MAG: hypothetical protein MUP85_15010 [Candidatus Lokiarchaeota archaeon]|nr:hypothetical protein [Candidatus Lokiarchaeota archaeon]